MAGVVIDKDSERKETAVFVSFFFLFSFCLNVPLPLGLAIISRRLHSENHSSQITGITQPVLRGTARPEREGTHNRDPVLRAAVYADADQIRGDVRGRHRTSPGAQEGFSLAGSRTEKNGEPR